MKAHQRIRKLIKKTRASAGWCLLILYGLCICQYTLGLEHDHRHIEDSCQHSDQFHEHDLCHLKLIHHDDKYGCKHPNHLSGESKKCTLCDLVIHFEQIPVTLILFVPESRQGQTHTGNFQNPDAETLFYALGRAPPVIS